ncbi:TetR/AcrR family transcriptional regulator [Streptomyces iconiensis]|uniref:Helix-turn-helix domain-containing protein n=1 Tax=Streptomyces iconiensis TaxID=1384038 RepID=A0ABT7A135_9ACTN|nr:TetR/AcrR family transcriptional regulator [Streptomyces iconiensis]MDJ1135029.1 helix-turn-helix domain-containing protein [Streptomyces iconiensis]
MIRRIPARTQTERSDATTARLLTAARRLFGADGYHATSIEAVASAAGVTKGAAYHHFRGKADLFRAVFTREQEAIADTLERVAAQSPDAWAALTQGTRTFLEHCLDPGFRRVVLLDGPAVLGWDGVREIECAHTLRVLSAGVRAAADAGLLVAGDLDARAQLVFGALCEGGMLLARADDPARALVGVADEARLLLGALRA